MWLPQIPYLLAGEIIGILLVVLVASAAIRLRKRRRDQREERPPQRTKLLRPPGYSLQQRSQDLVEKAHDSAQLIVLSGIVLGVALISFVQISFIIARHHDEISEHQLYSKFLTIGIGTGVLLLASVIGTVLGFRKMFGIHEEIRCCSLGLRGEQAVAEALQHPEIVSAGYTSFHDVPGDGRWNIDHVVVGPSGIFVIETKARSRRKAIVDQEEHVVSFDGQALQFPWCRDVETVPQAQRNAEWVRKFIRGFCPDALPVQPLIVVPGWYVRPSGNFPVKAMNAVYF
jgi:hypothetical protein